jgi:hypothetical protein
MSFTRKLVFDTQQVAHPFPNRKMSAGEECDCWPNIANICRYIFINIQLFSTGTSVRCSATDSAAFANAHSVPDVKVQVSGFDCCGNDLLQDSDLTGEMVLDDLHSGRKTPTFMCRASCLRLVSCLTRPYWRMGHKIRMAMAPTDTSSTNSSAPWRWMGHSCALVNPEFQDGELKARRGLLSSSRAIKIIH